MTFSEKERRGDLIQTLLRRNFKYSCSQIVSFIITLVFAYFVVAFVWNLWLILFQGVKPAESELHQQQLSSLNEQALITKLLTDSELIWKASIQKRNQAIAVYKHFFKLHPFRQISHLMIWDLFIPTFYCPRPIERIGRLGDGGKWICAFEQIIKKPKCLIYSFGIGNEITFEREILTRSSKCFIRMFDFTITTNNNMNLKRLLAQFPNNAQFYPIGLGSGSGQSYNSSYKTLKQIMSKIGDDDEFIDILKIDIEGTEFDALDWMINNEFNTQKSILPFGQLQLEIHLTKKVGNEQELFNKLVELFKLLEKAGLRTFSSEANQIPLLLKYNSYIACYEYSFLNSLLNSSYYL